MGGAELQMSRIMEDIAISLARLANENSEGQQRVHEQYERAKLTLALALSRKLDPTQPTQALSTALGLTQCVPADYSAAPSYKYAFTLHLVIVGLGEEEIQQFAAAYASICKCSFPPAAVQSVLRTPSIELVDVRWKFGVTVGSQELGRVARTFVQLALVTRDRSSPATSGAPATRTICTELSLPQFYALLHELERAAAETASS